MELFNQNQPLQRKEGEEMWNVWELSIEKRNIVAILPL